MEDKGTKNNGYAFLELTLLVFSIVISTVPQYNYIYFQTQ